jgi:hypothetical protein
MLKSRIQKLETRTRRRDPGRLLIVYENDTDRPGPTPEELADYPEADILRICYVDDWRGRRGKG